MDTSDLIRDFMKYFRERAPQGMHVCLFLIEETDVHYAATLDMNVVKELIGDFVGRDDLEAEEKHIHDD